MFEAPEERWRILAEAIKDRRDEIGITQAEGVMRAGGSVGSSTWSADSLERIIAGQEPMALTDAAQEQELLTRLWQIEETVRDLLVRFQRLEELRQQDVADPQPCP
jgi:hypothetical protein